MKYEIITCDKCNKKNGGGIFVGEYYIIKGREVDPSGNGYNVNWEYMDFCRKCREEYRKKHPDEVLFFLTSGIKVE
jgi:hypothetical protein